MKTLTTFTAVAALIAGISIASAQMSPSSSSPGANSASPEFRNRPPAPENTASRRRPAAH